MQNLKLRNNVMSFLFLTNNNVKGNKIYTIILWLRNTEYIRVSYINILINETL